MIGQSIAHYKITAKLGEGGMGEVFLATDTNLDRPVALKFLPPSLQNDSEARERLLREAKAASKLNHKNILTIYAVESANGRDFIVMEYVEGQSLKETLDASADLETGQILRMALQICDGLAAAHEQGVVHRDIKPANILVTPKGQVKITDFGLATWHGASQLTKEGTTVGTAAYMSPEQAQGRPLDHRSDLFSVGVVLYEMITRRKPFAGEHDAALAYAIVNESPEPLSRYKSAVHPGLQEIINRALDKDPSTRYQSATGMLADLKRVRRELEGSGPSMVSRAVAPPPKKSYLKYLVVTSVVFAVALTVLILKPFKVEIAPEQKATAAENSLAVMYFDNLADAGDKDKTAQMVTSLLITGLSESQYLRVVSRQRLHDILKLLGKEGATAIDRSTASDVAAKAGVKWILTGDILQTSPRIVLTAEVSEAETGTLVTTQRVTGEGDEDLFAVVDKLSAAIRNHLSLPESAQTEPVRKLAEVTTRSPEAYRYFLEGLECDQKLYYSDAVDLYKKAIAADSTFAMAYLRLSQAGDAVLPTMRKEWVAKAVAFSDKVSWKEQRYILAASKGLDNDYAGSLRELEQIVERYPDEKDALRSMGWMYFRPLHEPRKAIDTFSKILAIDPLDKATYNSLAYAYEAVGDFDKSLEAINKYIELAPDEANPYDTRADLYAFNGRLDEAIASYKKALELKPDFPSVGKLGFMYIYKSDFARAESTFQSMAGSADRSIRSRGRTGLALIPIHQGRFQGAFEILDQGIAADRMEQFEGDGLIAKLETKIALHTGLRRYDLALAELGALQAVTRRVNPDDILNWRDWRVEILAQAGTLAEAEDVARALSIDIQKSDTALMVSSWYAAGWIALARGDHDSAMAAFARATTADPAFWNRYELGRACLATGKLDLAVSEFEKILTRFDETRFVDPFKSILCHYYLGLAYEESGWTSKAIEQYQTFIEIWKGTDTEITELNDARDRLARLQS